MITTTIPFAKLRASDANVRKDTAYSTAGLAALAASIAGHGLLQPLIVSPARGKKTLFDVHAGGRRLAALGLLVEAGTLAKDHPVDVRLCEDEDAAARELSLAENLLHEPMTAAEECTAYRDIIAEGASAEDVARRFGVTVRHVHGRLRLADLAEPIFAALAQGAITLDVAMAYGAVADQTRQIAAWERCSTGWQSHNPQAIRRMVAEESLSGSDPIALFVGEAEYTAAGGRIERDLFAGEGEGTWTDVAIAQDLAMKKLTFEAEVAQLATKLAWVRPVLGTRVSFDETRDLHGYYPQYSEPSAEAQARMAEIQIRLDAIGEELNRIEDEEEADVLYDEHEQLSGEHDRLGRTDPIIPEEDLALIGTFLLLDREGRPTLAPQYYTSTKRASGDHAPGQEGSADGAGDDDSGIEADGQDAPADTLPRTLEEQLAKDRRDILALHVAHDPALALDLAIFSLARDHAGHFGYNDTGCSIRITDRFEPAGLKDIPPGRALEELEQVRVALPNDWALVEDSFASFLAFRALDEDARARWLAYAVSQSLQACLATGERRNPFQSQLGASLGIDVAQHWRPGAERFFDRLKKSQILAILGAIDPAMPGRYALAKKGELASAATKLCAGDAIVEPAIRERAITWTPEPMLFGTGAPVPDLEETSEGALEFEGEIEAEAEAEAEDGAGDEDESVLSDDDEDGIVELAAAA